MKAKALLSFVALLLLFSMLLVGCGPDDTVTTGSTTATPLPTGDVTTTEEPTTAATTTEKATTGSTTTEGTTTGDPEPEPLPPTPVTVTEQYLPSTVSQSVKTYFEVQKESAAAFSTQYAPYAIPDVYTLSDCTVEAITIPVMQTKDADDNGNFTFTVFVFGNSFAGMKSAPKRSYPIKINAEEYGLTENATNVYRYVEVDLSDDPIVLSADETMAFFAATDTLIPAYSGTSRQNCLSQLMMQAFEQSTAFYRQVGTGSMVINQGFFFFDFTLTRTYESQAAYDKIANAEEELDEMILALRERYEGKTLSVLGDSISTFTGVSQNKSYNATIGGNWVYYQTDNHTMYDSTDTYWGRVIKELDMTLCVPNAWSGSFVYGRQDTNYVDNMVNRATELDNDNGTPNDPSDDIAPDLIFVYIGINDLNNNTTFGDLYDLIRGQSADKAVKRVESWFTRVVQPQAEEVNGIVAGQTYTTWEQAYALGLAAMKEKYPNAEIILLTLAENNHGSSKERIAQFNDCIKALGAYFGATVIEQSQIVTQETCHAYGSDNTALHPSSFGHKRMAELILRTLYELHCAE